MAKLDTVADRFNWVREHRKGQSGETLSWGAWAKAIRERGDEVSKNTLSAIARGEIQNPSRRVVEAAARAIGVSSIWLHYGEGTAEDIEVTDDLPDRQVVIEAMYARGVSPAIIDRLRGINVRGDLATWFFLAAKLIQEDEALDDQSRARGDDRASLLP